MNLLALNSPEGAGDASLVSTEEFQEKRDLVPPYWVTAMVTRRQEGPDGNCEGGREYVLQGWILK